MLTIASHLYRTGHDLRMVITDEETTQSGKRDLKLLRLIARGRRWYEQLTSGEMPSLRAIARSEGLQGYLRRADLCGIASSTRHCRERPRGTAARHVYGGLLAHTATPRLGRPTPVVRISCDLNGRDTRAQPLPLPDGVWLPAAQSTANSREIPGKPSGGCHLEFRPGETRGEREASPPNETAEGVFPTIETAPRGADFDGGIDALAEPQGAWRCAQIRANQSP